MLLTSPNLLENEIIYPNKTVKKKKSTSEAETREASFLWSTRSRYKIRLASANRCKSIFEDTGEVLTTEPFSDYCPPKKRPKGRIK